MAISQAAKNYYEKMFSDDVSPLAKTDADFAAIFANFAFDEVIRSEKIDEKTRWLAITATLVGSQSLDCYKRLLPAALRFGLTSVEIKETLYQAVAYLGLGRVYPFLIAANEILADNGAAPLPKKSSALETESRLKRGEQAQVDIFGEQMRGFSSSGDALVRHINRWLTENCFGDYYTRDGLNYRQREMLTFCLLAAQGGCEAQLVSHAAANVRLGNDSAFLIEVVSQCLPYVGYPRSLNAVRCIFDAAKQEKECDEIG